jgi:DNA polymerase IIIc chi subunit
VSAVQVARLAVRETARHDLFQNPVDVAISNAEENLSSVAGTFSLVQPPDQDMVSLRDRVLDLVTHAQRQLEAARIAFRQRDIQTAVRAVEKAARDAKALARIAARY